MESPHFVRSAIPFLISLFLLASTQRMHRAGPGKVKEEKTASRALTSVAHLKFLVLLSLFFDDGPHMCSAGKRRICALAHAADEIRSLCDTACECTDSFFLYSFSWPTTAALLPHPSCGPRKKKVKEKDRNFLTKSLILAVVLCLLISVRPEYNFVEVPVRQAYFLSIKS